MPNGPIGETELQQKIHALLVQRCPDLLAIPVSYQNLGRGRDKGLRAAYKAIAAHLGCSIGAVQSTAERLRMERQGAELRAKEEEERKSRMVPVPFDPDHFGEIDGLIRRFQGWPKFFTKLQMLLNVHIHVAKTRGDVYAESYLLDMRDQCEKAITRASQKFGVEPPAPRVAVLKEADTKQIEQHRAD